MLNTRRATVLNRVRDWWTQAALSLLRSACCSSEASFGQQRPRLWIRAGLIAFFTAGVCACSRSDDDARSGAGGAHDGTGDELPVTLEFTTAGTLTLAPTEVTTLTVRVSRAQGQTVIFEILSEDVRFDGFLGNNAVRTQSDGRASVSMQAPSMPSTFAVRASLASGGEARLPVSVSSRGYGTIVVQPDYSGQRTVSEWSASARAGIGCEDLESLLTDGPLLARDMNTPRIESVPAGPRLAVSLRGNGLVTGCLDVPEISPDEELVVNLSVTDVPLRLAEGSLRARFNIESATNTWASQVERSLDEATALLTAMPSEAENPLVFWMSETLDASDAESFEERRSSFHFDTIASSIANASALTDSVRALLIEGATHFTSHDALVGRLSLSESEAVFTLESVGGAPPTEAGFTAESNWELSLEAGDTLSLGGRLDYRPLALLRAAAAARAETTEQPSPVPRLSVELNCSRLALELTDAASGGVYEGCGATCAAQLCEEGLNAAWDALITSTTAASLQVGAGAQVLVSDEPIVSALEGSWVGRLTDEVVTTGSMAFRGQVVAERH